MCGALHRGANFRVMLPCVWFVGVISDPTRANMGTQPHPSGFHSGMAAQYYPTPALSHVWNYPWVLVRRARTYRSGKQVPMPVYRPPLWSRPLLLA